MTFSVRLCLVAGLVATGAPAAPIDFGGGLVDFGKEPCLTEERRDWIKEQIAESRARLIAEGKLVQDRSGIVLFDWPLSANGTATIGDGYHGISNFVDQNPSFPDVLLDYNCGARTYDLASGYNHRGIDFFTWPFGWTWMDEDAVEIVAAADGTIVFKEDGNFDENCAFSGSPWNAVYVEHSDGSITWYGHMKNGSTTSKSVGESVVAGEVLGTIGSSGSSTGPHLHMETYDGSGNLIEPYAGPCNSLNANSWWADQQPYYDSNINYLMIGNAAPSYPACPGRFVKNETIAIDEGAIGYFTTFYRDQLDSQTSTYRLKRPDGTVWNEWTHSSSDPHYAASWWWWSWGMPSSPAGLWTFEVSFDGNTYAKTFFLGTPVDVEPDPATVPTMFLAQNRPNPFTPRTTLSFSVPRAMDVTVSVFDLEGRRVRQLLDGTQPAGIRNVQWDGTDDGGREMPSGVYFYRLESATETLSRRMTLVR